MPVPTKNSCFFTGDNLSSHFSEEVLRLCAKNDVEFVCLPPNSTHKLQPLDVGFFAPLKRSWRALLNDAKTRDRTMTSLPKPEIPKMMKALLESIDTKTLLKSAFRACGLFPVSVERALRDLPTVADSAEIATNVDSVLLNRLESQRYGAQRQRAPRGKQLPPGMSYSARYRSGQEEEEEDDDSTTADDLAGINDRPVSPAMSDVDGDDILDAAAGSTSASAAAPASAGGASAGGSSGPQTSLVAAEYEGEWFVAEKVADQAGVTPGCIRLSYMVPRGINEFMWPARPDIMDTPASDILVANIRIEPVNSRDRFRVGKDDFPKVKAMMVVVLLCLFS